MSCDFKADWISFREYIMSKFDNDVKYYIKDSIADFDPDESHWYFAEEQKVHIRNYLDIQLRILFEESWSEIGHAIAYPYYKDDPILREYTELLNRLAGLADEDADKNTVMEVKNMGTLNTCSDCLESVLNE